MWILTTAVHVWVLKTHLLLVSGISSAIEKYWCFIWLTFHYKYAAGRVVVADISGCNCSSSKSVPYSSLSIPLVLPTLLPPLMTPTLSDLFTVIQKDTLLSQRLVLFCLGDALWTLTRNAQHLRTGTFTPFGFNIYLADLDVLLMNTCFSVLF